MSRSRAMVLPIVIWCVAVAALITSATQLGCYRQAVMGRKRLLDGVERAGADVAEDHSQRQHGESQLCRGP